jgi:hypothetical protein
MFRFAIAVSLLLTGAVFAQDGGRAVYSFLEIPASARIAAMGGTMITVSDHDVNAALQAPSLLNESQDKSLAFSMVNYFDGVKLGDASYVHHHQKYGTFLASMHYASYGDFKLTNEFGDVEGGFKASDYCMSLGWGYRYNPRFSVGAFFKTIYSDYYLYNSLGVALDISATYLDTTNNFTATILARNVGVQLDNYVEGQSEPLPAEVLIGFSKRLSHTPLRFSVTYRHLEKFDLSYTDPNDLTDIDPLTGEASVKEISFGNNLSRHFIIGSEILLSRNFHLRAAYNFQRRQELVVDTKPGTVGFSLGFGLKISKFVFSYGRGKYHLAGASNHFSLSMNLGEFAKKKSR